MTSKVNRIRERKERDLIKLTAFRDAHRKACKYDPLELVCSIHNVKFIKFECTIYSNWAQTHGCPVCVGLIRAKVQLEFDRCCVRAKDGLRYPKNAYRSFNSNGKTKRGRPKTSPATTAIKTGNGISRT